MIPPSLKVMLFSMLLNGLTLHLERMRTEDFSHHDIHTKGFETRNLSFVIQAMLSSSEQFPPPPRLFRSRSDETLTHSEYSFHGRAFKSREAAMQELQTLKHHEEVQHR